MSAGPIEALREMARQAIRDRYDIAYTHAEETLHPLPAAPRIPHRWMTVTWFRATLTESIFFPTGNGSGLIMPKGMGMWVRLDDYRGGRPVWLCTTDHSAWGLDEFRFRLGDDRMDRDEMPHQVQYMAHALHQVYAAEERYIEEFDALPRQAYGDE